MIQASNPALVDMAAKYPHLYGDHASCDADYSGWRTAGDRVFLSVDFWRYAFDNPLVLEPYVRVLDIACPAYDAIGRLNYDTPLDRAEPAPYG